MKSDPYQPGPLTAVSFSAEDSSKLISVLALAAGALAMPQTSNADIIFTDLGTNGVTVTGVTNSSFLIDNLPGTARLGLQGGTLTDPTKGVIHRVLASQRAGYVRLRTESAFVVLAGPGMTWGTSNANRSQFGTIAQAYQAGHQPESFGHKYMLFRFKDSTQVGSPLRYGWVDLSLFNATGGQPIVTVFGYAYDNTGAKIPTGSVPEPAPIALLTLGALTLGAKGLRAWRRDRAASSRP